MVKENPLEVHAYDNGSIDIKQYAWFITEFGEAKTNIDSCLHVQLGYNLDPKRVQSVKTIHNKFNISSGYY